MAEPEKPPPPPPHASTHPLSLGEIGYATYGDSGHPPWKTYNGAPMPLWDDLAKTPEGQETQRRWEASALAIVQDYCRRVGHPVPTKLT